ncbi:MULTISPECIES: AAA family ATPase [Serratia]|uniref:AAA family ATPase n=1 Tax=Serratia TaxID=613 RepID=UPI0007455AEB|nr:AAA family ATPase [Serratia marcescens]EME1465397.1 AAA family ATPase [Serratia marcescens]MBN3902834.1 AAA family ATPase [Serratia marcescens]MBN3914512.1 AAA family ATPase [Serratia marcescens]MBN3919893.1 AAA family ATPase [Serratia marcescens]MBN3936578.1 AAA family ATPase [Serratia marcescens]
MQLISLDLSGSYKGLKDQFFDFSYAQDNIFALIGLNGSGKSQLLELIGETFSYLERWQRAEFKNKTSLGFSVAVHYQWDLRNDSDVLSYPDELINHGESIELKVTIELNGDVVLNVRGTDVWHVIQLGERQFPIPLVVGYASGLNENLQRSFMKNAVQYFEVRRISSQRHKMLSREINDEQLAEINKNYLKKYPHIFSPLSEGDFVPNYHLDLREVNPASSNFNYLDYDNVGLLILSLSILPTETVFQLLDEITYKHPVKAVLHYDFRSGIIEDDAIRDVKMLIRIAGSDQVRPTGGRTTDNQYELYELEYLSGEITLELSDETVLNRLREDNYYDSFALFKRLNNIQQLGIKNWDRTSRLKLMKDDFIGTLKKPLQSRLPLSVVELLMANEQGDVVRFDDLSDGEAQLIQVIAATRIFSQAQTLFLFDEPETHLNPSWRTYFHQRLAEAFTPENERKGQSHFILSTHSPFMISSLKRENVFFFERNDTGCISMEPVSSQTYGTSFDILVKNHYGLRSLISQTVVEDVKNRLPEDNDPEAVIAARRWIEENLGESMEKAYLLRKLEN